MSEHDDEIVGSQFDIDQAWDYMPACKTCGDKRGWYTASTQRMPGSDVLPAAVWQPCPDCTEGEGTP